MAQAKNTFGPKVGFDEQFDSRLMNAKSSDDKVAALKDAKRKSISKNGRNSEDENGDDENQSQPQSLREAVLAKKRAQAAKDAKNGKGNPSSLATNPIKSWSNKFLRASWMNLITSLGFTLFWINIHVGLSLILGKRFFCALGDEWATGIPMGKSMQGGRASEALGCVKMGERWLFYLLDFILALVIVCIIVIVSMMLRVVENPLAIFELGIGWIWNGIGIIMGK